jgi:hypothetical protein
MKQNKLKKPVLILGIVALAAILIFGLSKCALFSETRVVRKSSIDMTFLRPLLHSSGYSSDELSKILAERKEVEGLEHDNSTYPGVSQIGCYINDEEVVLRVYGSAQSARWWFEHNSETLDATTKKGLYKRAKLSKNLDVVVTPIYQYRDSDIPFIYERINRLNIGARSGNIIFYVNGSGGNSKDLESVTNETLKLIVEILGTK